ncbi:sigma-70 family RNA polymerase sigma factor [Corynebacterium pseudotuberculosis]|uniref:sigma-70 family RNA polymerase sigma factor n=1 Tax=Corynebacterium pseudotuberculosis TaxID=1719 RepID=UPI000245A452|nr:sigma-70 family RNA polymerase sigma factor [Corynebacterium pseudotuberculosis]ADK29892.2 sigma-70 family RNA polymerase sigma factor [Corynebacterium pseudotuberculosis FRC41]ADL21954.2 sigma-70 family RNA polymerase sigma factor [Corynebacterium pseudotuberculosis 1002]AEX40608.1 RNA polymerase sigma factor sigM [Corynebacterium pseudotuberculosis 3/99-5]AIG06341.1 RNA polymerase sigma-70 factor, ECF subfamily [Corynebacterium pseudotuberculosis]AIG09076.1 RNA polymerase sigma-70 factor,
MSLQNDTATLWGEIVHCAVASTTIEHDASGTKTKLCRSKTHDSDLVLQFLEGDNQAFNEIAKRHYRSLWWLARRHSYCDSDADDIMQEAMLKAVRSLERYRGDSSLNTWLYRLVFNTAYDHIYRCTHRDNLPLEPLMETRSRLDCELSHDPFKDHALSMEVAQAVNMLPSEQRNAILLVDFAGYDVDVAAQIEKVRPGTIKSRRARARKTLRSLLNPVFEEL